jgi:hypothetical protein
MDQSRALRYRKLALQEPDKEKAQLLLLIADESERGVLVTAEWLAPRPVKPPFERKSGPTSREACELGPIRGTERGLRYWSFAWNVPRSQRLHPRESKSVESLSPRRCVSARLT